MDEIDSGGLVTDSPVDNSVVEALEDLLERARAGRVNLLGVVYSCDEMYTGVNFTGTNVNQLQLLSLLQGMHTLNGHVLEAALGAKIDSADPDSQEPSDQPPSPPPRPETHKQQEKSHG